MLRALERVAKRWAPPPRLTVSEWADRFRFLSPEASAEPGRWDTARAEYQRGIMDAVSDPAVETVVIMKSAQVGGTEFLLNMAGFHIHQDPSPILVVQPTVEMGEAWSKDRLAPMLRDSPALRGRVADPKSRDGSNTRLHKVFPGGHLTIAGANSPASLASRPIRIVLADEIDRYPPSAGTEGDPVELAVKRTTTFWNRKIVLVSTPTTEGRSRIAAAYAESDKRRFYVPCPHCSHRQTLVWANVVWAPIREEHAATFEDEHGRIVSISDRKTGGPETARYHCAECGAGWTDAERWNAVRKGEWIAEGAPTGIAGFHISELYSPWRRLSETVRAFLAAKDHPERLKVWVNTALGETWREKGDRPDWERLFERREDLPMGEVASGALVLTAGVDTQDDRLEVSVWGWGEGLTSWLVDHVVIPGSPREDGPWDAFAGLMAREWPRSDGADDALRIAHACVDTGGRDTAAVYGQLRRLADPRVSATKGTDRSEGALVSGPTPVDAMVRGVKHRRGLLLWTVASSALKSELYGRLWKGRGDGADYPPGWVHIPKGVDAEFVKQLVAEELVSVKDRRGFTRPEWQKLRDRNEALDCAVLARAALWRLGADRYGARFWTRFARPEPPAPQPPVPHPPVPAPPVMQQPHPARRVGRSSYLTRIGR